MSAKPKTEWPEGVWQREPDQSRWVDAKTGLDCLVLRGPVGAWCGYVGVTSEHPAYGFTNSKYDYSIDEVVSGEATKAVNIQSQINAIDVHGGLTYAGSDDLRGCDRHWFGFDCSHAGDFAPGYEDVTRLGLPTGWGTVIEYRDMAYVQEECRRLAEQLAAIDPSRPPSST